LPQLLLRRWLWLLLLVIPLIFSPRIPQQRLDPLLLPLPVLAPPP
jgi:hypothetical protein